MVESRLVILAFEWSPLLKLIHSCYIDFFMYMVPNSKDAQ